jgi:AcrR family transcriptional regulator
MTKGQRTRERLLRAAIDRFGAEGFRATAVSQLSRDAGLTPAAAYAYFTDKEAMWTAAVSADLDALDAEIRAAARASDRPLYELMAGLVGGLGRHPLIHRVLEEGTHGDLLLVLEHRLFAETTSVMSDLLRGRIDAGVLPPGSEAITLALGIETVLFSMVLSIVRAGLEEDSDRIWAVATVLRAAAGGPPMPGEIFDRQPPPASPAAT